MVVPRGNPSLGPAELRRRDDPRRLPRIAEAEFDLDEPVTAEARAHRQRHAAVDDLEVRHLDSLATTGDLSPRRQRGGLDLDTKRSTGLSGRNNDNGSLNLEHRNLLNEQHEPDRPDGFRMWAGSMFR